MIGIYKITSLKGKIYIGQSKCIENRWKDYENPNSYKGQIRLYRSIIKNGLINHKFEIIEECLFEDLNNRERYWQDHYDAIGKNGLNCILTKTEELPRKVSDYMKKQMSIRMKKEFLNGHKNPRLNTGRKFNLYNLSGDLLKENLLVKDLLVYLNITNRSSINNTLRKNRYLFKKEYIVIPCEEDYNDYIFNCIKETKGEIIPIYQVFKNGEIKRCTSSSVTKVKNKILNSKNFNYYSKKNNSIYTFIGLINNAVQERNFLNY